MAINTDRQLWKKRGAATTTAEPFAANHFLYSQPIADGCPTQMLDEKIINDSTDGWNQNLPVRAKNSNRDLSLSTLAVEAGDI